MKLRNMTGIYLSCNGQMLLLYRQGGRVVSNQWIASAGGHFEKEELNDPKTCVLRELQEELHLCEEDLTGLKMRYIGLRNVNGEIRQNYYFFANLKPEHYELFTSNEGKCKWVDYTDIMDYDMPLTARFVMNHYLQTGQYTDCLYSAIADGQGFQFVPLAESGSVTMKKEIIVRKAEKEDVRQIAEILVEDWQKAYRGIIDSDFLDSMNVDQRYEIEIKRYQKYAVATDGDEILGYAWLETAEDGEADCEIIALYVRYSNRNNGIGKLLFQYAMRHFRESGKKRMIIWCLKENDEARRFYEKVGGQEFRTGSHYWGGKEYDMISYLYDLAHIFGGDD